MQQEGDVSCRFHIGGLGIDEAQLHFSIPAHSSAFHDLSQAPCSVVVQILSGHIDLSPVVERSCFVMRTRRVRSFSSLNTMRLTFSFENLSCSFATVLGTFL